MQDLGYYLHALRKRADLSQDEAAALIQSNRRTVERWEAGRHEPGLTTIQAYVTALGGSIDHAVDLLLGRKTQPPNDPPGVVVARSRMADLPAEVIEAITPAIDEMMRSRGLS